MPAKYKGESWARLGVDIEQRLRARSTSSAPDRKPQVTKLKTLLKDADELYLATDEDREGEAIAWHLVETLKPKVPVRRMVFHEITPPAIAAAVANPREIDDDLVDAQETRRILDRLYGYEVSPVLWKKVLPRLSAGPGAVGGHPDGRRARARADGVPSRPTTGTSPRRFDAGAKADDRATFTATLVAVDGTRSPPAATSTPPDRLRATGANVLHLDEAGARGLAAALRRPRRSPSRPSRRSRTAAVRTRRS